MFLPFIISRREGRTQTVKRRGAPYGDIVPGGAGDYHEAAVPEETKNPHDVCG